MQKNRRHIGIQCKNVGRSALSSIYTHLFGVNCQWLERKIVCFLLEYFDFTRRQRFRINGFFLGVCFLPLDIFFYREFKIALYNKNILGYTIVAENRPTSVRTREQDRRRKKININRVTTVIKNI